MIRLLHSADIHLDSPLKSLALRDAALAGRVRAATRAAFARIVDLALAERVAAVLIAGDLFDGAERSARTAAFLTAQLDRLRATGIRVFYIKGNHDAENPITGEVELPENVHVFDGRGGKVQLAPDLWIHGVSFAGRHAAESLVPKLPAPVAGAVNIAMLHTSLAGAAGHDVYAPCTLAELKAQGFDYWALGHVHQRQVHARDPWIVMPGMPQGRDMGEAGVKSVTLITIADGIGVSEVPVSVVEFTRCDLDVSGLESDADLRDALRAALGAVAEGLRSDDGIVRVTLQGATARRWQLLRDRDVWAETASELARETGRLWLERLEMELAEPDGRAGAGATDELAQLMETIAAEDAFAGMLRAELEAVLAELPPQRRAALIPDAAAARALAATQSRAGADWILARMKGGAG